MGIPVANYIKLWPTSIAGEKLNVIILDDATDPTKGVQNAKRFVTEDKVDLIIGSAATPVAGPMAAVAAETVGDRDSSRRWMEQSDGWRAAGRWNVLEEGVWRGLHHRLSAGAQAPLRTRQP